MRILVSALVALNILTGCQKLDAAPQSDEWGSEQSPPMLGLPEAVQKEFRAVSNWGRWGVQDQRGTLNNLTERDRLKAAKLIQSGRSVSLGVPVDDDAFKINDGTFKLEVRKTIDGGAQFASDRFQFVYHGYSMTHIDALSHMSLNGMMYNGFAADDIIEGIDTDQGNVGVKALGVNQFCPSISGRGVLMDLPRFANKDFFHPGTIITEEMLDEWEERTGTKVRKGDIVFIRTGRWHRDLMAGPRVQLELFSGLHYSAASWFHERDVAVLGTDWVADVRPSGVQTYQHPFHLMALVAMGMPLIDNAYLEDAADVARLLNRETFFVTINPLCIPKATGAPVNPVAQF